MNLLRLPHADHIASVRRARSRAAVFHDIEETLRVVTPDRILRGWEIVPILIAELKHDRSRCLADEL